MRSQANRGSGRATKRSKTASHISSFPALRARRACNKRKAPSAPASSLRLDRLSDRSEVLDVAGLTDHNGNRYEPAE